jgi:hypothetical protein
MSDQRAWARQTLAAAAAEFATWRPSAPRMTQSLFAHASKPSLIVGGSRTIETEIVAWEANNETYRATLIAIAADAKVEKVVAAFGDKISLTKQFIREARRFPPEEAVRQMMHFVAVACADPIYMTSGKEIVETRERIEAFRRVAETMPPSPERDKLVLSLNAMLKLQASLDDPTVERRKSSPIAKRFDGAPPSDAEYSHALAVWRNVRNEARRIFGGKTGDRITDVFVAAATGIIFTKSDNKLRRKSQSPHSRPI